MDRFCTLMIWDNSFHCKGWQSNGLYIPDMTNFRDLWGFIRFRVQGLGIPDSGLGRLLSQHATIRTGANDKPPPPILKTLGV